MNATCNLNLETMQSITIEIFNYPDVKFEPIEKRECRFPFENISQHLPLENIYQTLEYSFTNCFLTKRIQIELEKCNCTLPTSPKEYKHKYCDFNGLICISKVFLVLICANNVI
uniref:(northern house mosquito) hypothetical protein n=1 Tax=Culex pipiens TaxID=7175 RepID=A0A8D8NXI7_CULPI